MKFKAEYFNNLMLLCCIPIVILTSVKDDIFIDSAILTNFFRETTNIMEKLPHKIFNVTQYSQLSILPNSSTIDFIGPWLSEFKYHELYFHQKLINESIQVIHMKDLYVTRQCIFFSNSSFYYVRPTCQFDYKNNFNGSRLVSGYYSSVIAICHIWTHNYAHVVFDVLIPLALIPQSVLNQSYIVATSNSRFTIEMLNIFNFQPYQILCISTSELIYGENVYTINPHSFYNFQRLTLMKFRNYCIRKYSLNQFPPYRFVYFNRFGPRSIVNFNAIMNDIRRDFPQYRWETRKAFSKAVDTLKYLNEVLFFFGPHGADVANIVFLQESAIVCEIQPNAFVSCYLILSNLLGLHHIIGRIPTMEFSRATYNILPYALAYQIVEQALKYLE